MEKSKAGIIEVAKRAGVSVATVSRVVNGSDSVKADTREKVKKVIDEMNYVPYAAARELASKEFSAKNIRDIGVILPSIYNEFFAEVLEGIEHCLRHESYFLMLNCARNSAERETECIRAMVNRKVSGIIVLSPNTQDADEEFYRQVVQEIPMVFVNAYFKIPGASYVENDEQAGTQEAIRYLFELGHKKILMVSGINSDSYTIKEETFKEMMKSEGVDGKNYIVNVEEGNSPETADLAADILLETLPKTDATAIFCCNDLMAVGALYACKYLGLRVPEDISVIGYDNTNIANMMMPKLTSVDQNMFQLGRNAAQLLIEKIETGQAKRITFYNTIVERESTGPAKSEAEQ